IRGRVVAEDHHQPDGVAQRNRGAGADVVGEDAATGDFVRLVERNHVVRPDLAFRVLVVRLDHYGKLDETGRRHRLVGVKGVRIAAAEVLDNDGDLALVRLR